jgi:hypothetical protein
MQEAVIKRVSLRKNVKENENLPLTLDDSKLKAKPSVWLGAKSPFGIALPDAKPSATQMYAPRGVFHNDDFLVAADSGNHRIMIWKGIPTDDQTPADIVLGQPDFETEGAKANGKSTERGMHLPTGVKIIEGKLFVADSWHHRILVWNEMPTENFQKPDYVIGQKDLTEVTENRGQGKCSAETLYWCYGFNYINGIFYIADTGNRRVLGFRGIPEQGQPADFVVGQDDFETNLENRGLEQTADGKSFRWVHEISGNSEMIFFADAGNHRVLGWNGTLDGDRAADIVLGQENFEKNSEFPYIKQGASRLRFPYSVSVDGDKLAVADTANNRVLLWEPLPTGRFFQAAESVIGQPDFNETGENRWKMVDRDTLCWVYGIHLYNNKLAVADSGNNRVMIWEIGN